MKKILVPVDFSPCSYGALVYARSLADTLGFSIKVVHVYSSNLNPNEPLVLLPGKTTYEALTERLEEWVQPLQEDKNEAGVSTPTQVETKVISALNTSLQIAKLTRDEEVAMVVMGTTGAGNVIEKMLGSVSSAVAQRAHCPVMLIPKGLVYEDYKNVLYASNYESADEDLIQQIIDFANIFKSTMHFVHVEEEDNYENVEDTIFYKLFEKGDPSFAFNIVNIHDRNVMDGINQYADENDIDLVVLVNRQRSYFENFLQLSLTKKMARRTTLPLLVLHLLNE